MTSFEVNFEVDFTWKATVFFLDSVVVYLLSGDALLSGVLICSGCLTVAGDTLLAN